MHFLNIYLVWNKKTDFALYIKFIAKEDLVEGLTHVQLAARAFPTLVLPAQRTPASRPCRCTAPSAPRTTSTPSSGVRSSCVAQLLAPQAQLRPRRRHRGDAQPPGAHQQRARSSRWQTQQRLQPERRACSAARGRSSFLLWGDVAEGRGGNEESMASDSRPRGGDIGWAPRAAARKGPVSSRDVSRTNPSRRPVGRGGGTLRGARF